MNWKTLDNPLLLFERDDPFAKVHVNIATKSPPPELFHYTSSESLLAIIESQNMLATERSYLNDTQEFSWGFQALQDFLHSDAIEQYPREFTEQAQIAMQRGDYENIKVFVLSLSANPDLLSQWRAYASGGAGYAIGLDGATLRDRAGFGEMALKDIDLDKLPNDAVFCYHLLPVIYERCSQRIAIAEFVRAAHAFWQTIEESDAEECRQVFRFFFYYRAKELLISFKNPGYTEECEWRIVATVHAGSRKIRFRHGRFGVTPYVKLNLSRRIDLPNFKLPVSTIRTGPNSPAKTNPIGLEMLLKAHGVEVRISHSEIEYRT